MLFSDRRRHSLALPSEDEDGHASNIAFLIDHLCQHVMKDTRQELFVLEGHLYVPDSWPLARSRGDMNGPLPHNLLPWLRVSVILAFTAPSIPHTSPLLLSLPFKTTFR